MEREMKIEIHVAENGKSYELECQPSTTIQDLQSILPQISGIPVQDQMLITAQDNRLEAHRTLHSYALPSKNKLVFLFNRCRLAVNSPYPPPEDYELINVDVPPPPSVAGSHPLDEASDPALKALPSYERQFKYHYEKGLAIITASQMKFDACRRLLREQEMQDKAMETARGNMDHFYKIIKQSYSEFTKNYNRQYKQHSELLTNVDRDLDRLRNCKLHPGLCTPQFKTLLDCVKEARVRKWAEDCANSFRQLNAKVADLKENYSRLDNNVQTLFSAKPIVNVRKLAETIDGHNQFIEEQASIIQSLSKDVNTVKKLVDDCVTGQHPTQRNGPLRPHDAVSALGPMYDVHDKMHLPRMEECDRELGKLLKYCQDRKTAMTRSVHSRLQSVASLQSGLKDLRNQLAVFKEAMNRQAEYFTELRIVRRMGSAYKACLAEVVRRKAWMKLFMGQAGQLAERMARKREVEMARRDDFLKEHLLYFNREVLELLGLYENPSLCVVNIPPFDTNLLELDVIDVERYAPEALVGPLLKIAGTRSFSDSAFHSGGESPSGGARGEDYDGEVDDYGDTDEINGTSKLEVENAWLKSELASAVARLCHLVPDFESEEAGDMDDSQSNKDGSHQSRSALQSTNDALRLKDEYAKHLRGLLHMRTGQCQAYEKRIRELEQRLQDQHMQMQQQKFSNGLNTLDGREQGADSESSGLTALRGPGVPEPMDEGASSLGTYDGQQLNQSSDGGREVETGTVQNGREREALDETMSDVSGVVSGLDAAMEEGARRSEVESQLDNRSSSGAVDVVVNVNSRSIDDSAREARPGDATSPLQPVSDIPAEVEAHIREERVLGLQNLLVQKTQECEALEERLRVAAAEVGHVRSELESNRELLNECQVNCAHLENRLHEAREEARINLCAADRRATEYNALRASSVRLRGLTERLRSCIATPGVGFAESLRALAVSLSSSSMNNDSGEDVDFRNSIKALAEKVGILAQQRAELLERCTIAENNQNHLTKTLDDMKKKRQMEKQASKEMICFTRFHVHGLAVFLPNGSGHYEALNRNCPNYFLSDESIALFLENLPNGQHYIVGQIVHIDRSIARSSSISGSSSSSSPGESEMSGSGVGGVSRSRSNPYGLPLGTEYFVVTVAMVPDFSPLSLTI